MSHYTKTFALCDNVDVRVHCETTKHDYGYGVEYDEEYLDVELIIGKQVVKLEGEIPYEIDCAICKIVDGIDAPDGVENARATELKPLGMVEIDQ